VLTWLTLREGRKFWSKIAIELDLAESKTQVSQGQILMQDLHGFDHLEQCFTDQLRIGKIVPVS
jgi:hypothetical protein